MRCHLAFPNRSEDEQTNQHFGNLKALHHQLCYSSSPLSITHQNVVDAVKRIYAPAREEDDNWQNTVYVGFISDIWFWAAVRAAAGIDEEDFGWS